MSKAGKYAKAWRRAAAVGMAGALAFTVAGCGGDSGGGTVTGDDGKPLVKILVVKSAGMIPMEEMGWTKDLQKDCDCTIQWTEVNDDAWGQQRNPTLAAGDVADITIRGFAPNLANEFPVFEELSQHLDKMPNVKQFFDEKPEARQLVQTPEDKIFILPSSRGKDYRGSGQHMMINKQWLDNLGLDIPKTWDEFENVLEHFKNDDPNGNGQQDEIPFNIAKIPTWGFGWFSPMLLMNSTGIVTSMNKGPSNQGIYVKDGKVGNFMVTEEYKEVIKYLNHLYSKGLIPQDVMTRDDSVLNSQLSGDGETALTGAAFVWSAQSFGPLSDQYVAMPAPAAPGVDQSEVVWDGSDNEYEDNKIAVKKDVANLDTVLKIVDLLYSEKYSVQQLYGTLGEDLTEVGDRTYEVNDRIYNDSSGKLYSLRDRLAGWISDDVTFKGAQNVDYLRETDDVYAEQYGNYDRVKDMMPDFVRVSAEDAQTLSTNDTQILNYALQKASSWIINGGIDEEWDEYVNQLENTLGMKQSVEIWQKWYDTYTK